MAPLRNKIIRNLMEVEGHSKHIKYNGTKQTAKADPYATVILRLKDQTLKIT